MLGEGTEHQREQVTELGGDRTDGWPLARLPVHWSFEPSLVPAKAAILLFNDGTSAAERPEFALCSQDYFCGKDSNSLGITGAWGGLSNAKNHFKLERCSHQHWCMNVNTIFRFIVGWKFMHVNYMLYSLF